MNRNKRKLLRLLAALVALAVVAAACGSDGDEASDGGSGEDTEGSGDGDGGGDSGSGDNVVINLWLDQASASAECFAETALGSFDEPGITVEHEILQNAWDTSRTAISGGAGPEVVTTPGPSFAFELAQAGALVPMDDYVDSLGLRESFVDWALKLGVVDDTLYSVPTELETMVLYYNKTLFEENGWSPPTTIDELVALADEIAAAGITPFSHGNADWRPANEWFVSAMFNAHAGPENVYAALTGEKPFSDPEFTEAIAVIDDFQQKGYFSGGVENYYTLTFDETLAALGNGEAAMNIEGSWRLDSIDTFFGGESGNTNEWDWAPFPSASGEETYAIGIGSTYSINQNAEFKDEAASVIAHIFKPETQAALAVECGNAPAPVRLSEDMFEGLDERNARLYSSISTASDAGNYGYLTWTFWPPQSDVYIYEEIERVWAGELTSQDYVDGLADLFDQEFEAGDLPPLPARS